MEIIWSFSQAISDWNSGACMCSNAHLSTDPRAGAWLKLVFVHDLLHKELDIAYMEHSEKQGGWYGESADVGWEHKRKKRWSSFFLGFGIF
jgi:hypothetical protein